MVSQFNVWYLDDGNLSDHYRTVLEDLKRIISSADEFGLSPVKSNSYLIFLGNCSESSKKRIKTLFEESCQGIKVEDREILEILGSPMGANARTKKMIEWQRLSEVVTKLDAQYGFYLLKNCLVYPNYCTFFATDLALKSWISYSNMIPISANHCPKSVMSILMKAAIFRRFSQSPKEA